MSPPCNLHTCYFVNLARARALPINGSARVLLQHYKILGKETAGLHSVHITPTPDKYTALTRT